jgi:adenylate cyclase
MPANNGIRPNDGERLAGLRKQLADPTQNHPVDGQKWHPTGPNSSQHNDLLPQHEDLGFQRRARSDQIDDNPKNYSAEIQHPADIIRFCVSRQLDGIYDRDSGETLRRRIDVPDNELDFPILHDLKAAGATDYFALPIKSSFGTNHVVTYVTDRIGGFITQEISDLTHVSQRLPLLVDPYLQRRIATNILNAYLGPKTGPKVLAGQIRRGTGEEITAVLWSSDLRGFTKRSDRLAGDQVIAILNTLFDAQAKAIASHGGEILKFIGDGLLAIFPIENARMAATAADNALAAAMEAVEAVRGLVSDPSLLGEPPLEIVIALHIGTAIYGNIGAADRLDFTVIGPAVNLVSRIEAVAKRLDQPIVVSDDFARAYGKSLHSLGRHELRGLATFHDLFAPTAPTK